MSFIDILKAAVSVLSGGGVGVGDSLDMLNADLAMRTCRADGKLLHLDKPLTVTPLQLQRMATHCKASVPHSCIGEIWSGYTALVGGHYFSTILVHSNNGLGSSQKREFVSPHLLGLEEMPQNELCYIIVQKEGNMEGSIQSLEYICTVISDLVPIPIQKEDEWSIVYISPTYYIEGAQVALIGELGKISMVSRDRISSIDVNDYSVSVTTICSDNTLEIVSMQWAYTFPLDPATWYTKTWDCECLPNKMVTHTLTKQYDGDIFFYECIYQDIIIE